MQYANLATTGVGNLMALSPAGADVEAYVLGRTSLNDGAGGYFIFRTTAQLPIGTAADNGIYFTSPTAGGLWERQFQSENGISVKWFGSFGDGTTDDTLAFQRTIDFCSANGYNVYVPKGVYVLDRVLLKSNIEVRGEGDLSALRLKKNVSNPAAGADYIFLVNTSGTNNIRIKDLKFEYQDELLSAQKHFICLNGVNNLLIENCFFLRFRGDAIYIGEGVGGTRGLHNELVIIKNCRFNGGPNRQNRNAISVIDGYKVTIENNTFESCVNDLSPAAIDIEPDDPPSGTHVVIIKDIIIQNNKFLNIGGYAGCCCVLFPPFPFAQPPSGIYILNNYSENTYSGYHYMYNYIPAGGVESKIEVPYYLENNILINVTNNGFVLQGASGAKVISNYFNTKNVSTIGYINPENFAKDITLANNNFYKCGSDQANGLLIYSAKRVKIQGNTFNDCGLSSGGNGKAINFYTGASEFVSIEQNIFLSPTGKTIYAIIKEGHTFSTPRSNRFENNIRNGLPSQFEFINDFNCGLFTGSTLTASVTIPHNLGGIPKWGNVIQNNNNVAVKYITLDATFINVFFSGIPIGGVSLYWSVQADLNSINT